MDDETIARLEELERRMNETARGIICSGCGAPCNPYDGAWRYGVGWEHKCPGNHPQCGHQIGVKCEVETGLS